MRTYRYSLIASLTLVVALGTLWAIDRPTPLERERAAYQTFINEHPYMQPDREHPDGPPGLSSPGEASEFEFLRTVDPVTKGIPYERLWRANEIGQQQLRNRIGQPPAVTSAWVERGPNNVGGRTRAMLWDPNTTNKFWAAGVSGGLWTTSDITDPAQSWTKQNDFWENIAVTAIEYDPNNTQIFYVTTGEGFFNFDAVRGGGVWKSTNGGTSFTRLASTTGADFTYLQDIDVTGASTVLLTTRDEGLQRSTDGGASWTKVLGFGTSPATTTDRASDIEIAANGDIYVSFGIFSSGGVYKSTDDGVTWTQQTLPFAPSGNAPATNNYQRIELCTAPSDANTVYAATQQANGSGTGANAVNHVFKTTDGGANWASVTTPTPTNAQAWYDLICTVDPNDPDDVMLGVAVRVYRSLDGGATWTNRAGSLHPDHHEILYRPGSSTEAVFGHDGGVDYSSTMSNAQPTYISRDNGYNVTQYYGGDLSPANASNVIVGGTQDNSTQYISASGIANATSPSPLSCCDGGFTIIDQDDANFAIGMIQFGASSRSFDGGQTYGPTVDTGGFFLGQNSGLFIAAMAFDDKEDLMYTTRGTNQMIRVSNIKDPNASPTLAGLTVPGLGSTASTFAPSPYAAPGVSTVFVGSTSGNVVRVDNAQTGATPPTTTITGTINAGNISSIDIGASENQLLVTVSNYGVNSVYETLDGGTTWTNKDSATLPDIPVRWALYNPNNRQQVILGTESGIWETLDINASPVTWTRAPGFPTVRVDQLQARTSDGRVTAITHGRGFFEATFSPAPLPVELTAFDAIAGPEGVDLSWTTATETDNAGFAVEVRGPDADTFEQVAFVGGAGTTAEPQAYRFRVESLDLGPHTFRLKQIDFDGQFEYSSEVETTVTPSTPFVLSAPYPNPAVERSTLEIGLAETQDVRIAIFDVQGRRIRTVHDGELSANRTYRFGLEVGSLPAGTYLVRVAGPRLDETRRFTVIK